MKVIAKYLGGSHLYGIQVEGSDEDVRGIYVTENITDVFGFTKNESHVVDNGELDISMFELKRYLQLLQKTNVNVIETLFTPDDSFLEITPIFEELRLYKSSLINSGALLGSLKGYIYNETKLALGERTGKLGGKRREALDKYGFSPKNVSHLIRLSYCGKEYFETGIFPTNLVDTPIFDKCLDVKINPENYTVSEIEKTCQKCIDDIHNISDKFMSEFDVLVACRLLTKAYKNLF